jgi:hypothetical protein
MLVSDFAVRRPLGAAVIGGVVTSTLLTLLVIPRVYERLDRARERALGRPRQWALRTTPPPVADGVDGLPVLP